MSSPGLDEQGLPRRYPFNPDWELTPRQVRELRAAGEDIVLIDCRTEQEAAIARIEGAVLIPLQHVRSRLDDIEDMADKRIVIHCHHGMRSLRMTGMLRQAGIEDVWSMAGGIDLWAIDIEPGMPRY